jgi:Phage integrase, N-terminal SAM-like domain
VYGKTRKEAADKLADLVAKTSAGVPLAARPWTVAGYAAHWLEEVVRPRLKSATFMSYRETLRLHILPSLGRVKV